MRNIPSKSVHHGENAEHVAYRDDRYVRCGRCKHVVHLDRHMRAPYGSRAGQGVTHAGQISYDEAGIEYNNKGYTYDGFHSDFTITGGCPFCGAYTFDKEERKSRRRS